MSDYEWSSQQTVKLELFGFQTVVKYESNSMLSEVSITSIEFENLSERQVREILAAEPNYMLALAEEVERKLCNNNHQLEGYELSDYELNVYGHGDEVFLKEVRK